MTHGCVEAPFNEWHPACRGVLERYVEQELHLNLWRSQLVCCAALLIFGSVFSYCTVGSRTAVDVVLDGARYMQVDSLSPLPPSLPPSLRPSLPASLPPCLPPSLPVCV